MTRISTSRRMRSASIICSTDIAGICSSMNPAQRSSSRSQASPGLVPRLVNDLPFPLVPAHDQEVPRGHIFLCPRFRWFRVLPELALHPEPELRRLSHPAERGLLVLELTAFLPGLARCPRGLVHDPDARVTLVLVLASLATGMEGLHIAVLQRDGEDGLTGSWFVRTPRTIFAPLHRRLAPLR